MKDTKDRGIETDTATTVEDNLMVTADITLQDLVVTDVTDAEKYIAMGHGLMKPVVHEGGLKKETTPSP